MESHCAREYGNIGQFQSGLRPRFVRPVYRTQKFCAVRKYCDVLVTDRKRCTVVGKRMQAADTYHPQFHIVRFFPSSSNCDVPRAIAIGTHLSKRI